MYREEALRLLAKNLPELRNQYGVEDLSIFGSVARNQAHINSDLDVLIDFATTPGLLRYVELKNRLEDLLGIPVDIVTRKALKRQLRDTILSEAIRVC